MAFSKGSVKSPGASPKFSPIAIVGRACVLPGALSPEQLWQACADGRDLVTSVAPDRWRLPPRHALRSVAASNATNGVDTAWSDRGGYVRGFEDVFDAQGFQLEPARIEALDPLVQWLLHTGREALRDAGNPDVVTTGAVIGNLSFPSSGMSRFAEQHWLGELAQPLGLDAAVAEDRFMSGLPAHLLGAGLGLGRACHAIDAACASSLYAIKLACDALHAGRADTMLAGAVNRADDLFLHVGFCALQALSRTGRSRPFHAQADGLVPASGAGLVVLQRLEDAVAAGARIYGVIRGVGLSNDGRAKGFLAPAEEGQRRSMRAAYDMAAIEPAEVSLLECHATGTSVGDSTEVRSSGAVFEGCKDVPIGSLKSNLGHLITTAGVAGLIKVLESIRHQQRAPTLHASEPIEALDESPFRLLTSLEPWPADRPRVAAVSAFGFGGNNAHLLVTEHRDDACAQPTARRPAAEDDIVIVGVGALVGDRRGKQDVLQAFCGEGGHPKAEQIVVPLPGLRFPPRDLEQTLPQQLMMLEAAREAVAEVGELPRERTAVLVGMGCDPEVARYGARWRSAGWAEALGVTDTAWTEALRAAFVPVLKSAGVLGTMPNIPANRLNSQFDIAGPSMAVSAEELSGLRALQIAVQQLRSNEVDAALVGAVDMSCEPVHCAALEAMGRRETAGDAAIALVLKRREDAQRDGDRVYARLCDEATGDPLVADSSLIASIGKAHAAWGLVQLAANVMVAAQRGRADAVRLQVTALGEQQLAVGFVGPSEVVSMPAPVQARRPASTLPAHLPAVKLPPLPLVEPIDISLTAAPVGPQAMPAAPALPPTVAIDEPVVASHHDTTSAPTPDLSALASRRPALADSGASLPSARAVAPVEQPSTAINAVWPTAVAPAVHQPGTLQALAMSHHQRVVQLHTQFVATQAEVHAQFLRLRAQASNTLLGVRAAQPGPPRSRAPAPPSAAARGLLQQLIAPPAAPALTARPPVARRVSAATPTPAARRAVAERASSPKTEAAASAEVLPGPRFSRADLEIHASGAISQIYGPQFVQQDGYKRQVRMPEPPLLLADRVIGLDAQPGSMGKGSIWTETDVSAQQWYLHNGRMPAGIMIESGQADLMLISYLGIDFINRSERVYRLLGCDLTYHGELPRPGDTLRYDIHCDGHAKQGNIGLFFFHYDCRVDGALRLSVREGQAGFFSDDDLAASKGILWAADSGERTPTPRLDDPAVLTNKRSFSSEDLQAWAAGDTFACFGPGFERAQTHTRTPTIATGKMLLLEEVTDFAPGGGPWGRGYLRAIDRIEPSDWFFDGHFKNDPCMPGTLMFEGCLQAMAVYLAGLGYTIDNDAWRFAPVPEATYKLRCRGQVLPTSQLLEYELFIDEIEAGPYPTLWADVLCTVDGLKAFHCRRLGLRLVPDWPLEEPGWVQRARPGRAWPRLLREHVEPRPVAQIDGFKFDFKSLMACAWGRPSDAFGEMYRVFDGARRVARLPGPPYHFMSRVTRIDGEIGRCEPGAVVELEYDVPADAWYFGDNGAATMPFCVFLEAALQPCGWLASFVGSALTTEEDLFFRNLDGTATWHRELLPGCGTLTTRVKITNISKSAGMIIESFDVTCRLGDDVVYDMKTVFGFFPAAALAAQKGLAISDEQRRLHDRDNDVRGVTARLLDADGAVDLRLRDAPWFQGSARLPSPFLLMIDRVRIALADGGPARLGVYRAEKDVDPDEWFFKAHFFQDPVQPGSLGIEAMIQLLQFAMLHQQMDRGLQDPSFEPLALGRPLSWKYRGQVRPHNEKIGCTVEITERGRDERGVYAIADASLWVDGLRIYEASGLGMRLVERADRERSSAVSDEQSNAVKDERISVARVEPGDPWLRDHQPTFTVPAVPLMVMVDWIAAAAQRRGGVVVGLRDVTVKHWLTVTAPTSIEARVAPAVGSAGAQQVKVTLFADGNVFATGSAKVVASWAESPPAPAAPPAIEGAMQPDPYVTGRLFHGPALAVMRAWKLGARGASALLDADPGPLSSGPLNARLLDGATHPIPHDSLDLWGMEAGHDAVAYPARVSHMEIFGPAPITGEVRCEVRCKEPLTAQLARFEVHLLTGTTTWCRFELVEALFPKGPIGAAPAAQRRAFLRDFSAATGVGLSVTEGGVTKLDPLDVERSDWLAGTVAAVFGTDEPRQIAAKEHIARKVGVHPRMVPAATPLNRFPLSIQTSGDADSEFITVQDADDEQLDLTPVRTFWDRWFGLGRWPVEDVYYSVVQRFLRRVVLPTPGAMGELAGKSVLYVANHQTGVESLVFSIVASGLTGVPTVTLAKAEHRHTWLGQLIAHCFEHPGVRDPKIITFFDRSDKASLPRIIRELQDEMVGPGRSVMVHVEGTRALSCREPVRKMSSAFIDMALRAQVPIVPVRFVGGLPVEPLAQRIEFPIGMGRQDIWLGAPVMPDELSSLPLKQRKELVLSAINELGPACGDESPLDGDPALVSAVDEWGRARKVSAPHATLLRVLQQTDNQLTEPIARLVRAADGQQVAFGESAQEHWLEELAKRLLGDG